MSTKPALLPEPFTIELPASDLPEQILARFSERPSPEARFAVTIEPAQTEMEKVAALRRDIEEGLADMAAGERRRRRICPTEGLLSGPVI